ncbi:PR domain zinc finger protein 13 [Sipha flava]|uniref:PR domain zinc finger protein 13 n=2 Tax=Sipha flava TaxID=143950 RepID=A0A8B8G1J9_9HEMI|nr:PR domain zinc finger protein 13 [Sipha flava]XP_025417114.1 PR domain zinc finger protein 13 [Sipha flava]
MRLSNGSEGTTDSMVEMLQFNEHFLDEDGAKFMLNPAELDDLLGRDQYAADGSPIVVSAQQQHHHGHHHHHHQQQQPNNVDQPNTKPASNFADLKPLMPFHTITERVNINGIPGHHYQSIASNNRVAENNNNTATANNNMYYQNEYLVTSSTNSGLTKFKEEDTFVDNQFDEFEMLMGSPSFGPDTTVTASGDHAAVDGPDEWLSVGDEWASYEHPNGSPQDSKSGILADVTIHDLVASSQFPGMPNGVGTGATGGGASTGGGGGYHQQPPSMQQKPNMYQQPQQPPRELVTSNVPPSAPRPAAAAFMPLLQSRLQNGPANKAPLQDAGSYHMDCASSPSSSTPSYLAHSPTSHVVSTTDLGGYLPSAAAVHSSRPSPEFAHTTTPGQGAHMVTKKSRNRSGKTKGSGGGGGGGGGGSGSTARSTVVYCSDGNVARERTVHNCHICNRGFLNKSNIKVHLRTHTGEKPFRCEVCQKAFRQKAHLIKHAQIHKRSGRD